MDLAFATVDELGRLLRRRSLSTVELIQATIARLGNVGVQHGAVVATLDERALASARRADRLLAEGRATALTGIPFGVKDMLDIEGAATEFGSRAYPARSATVDARLIQRLEDAGAILVARLSMMELAGAGGYRYATASTTGVCRNPWDRTRWSGGSSSGAGAAVAAGCLPIAFGSETGGSVVIPAAFCGVTGLRPSFGMVPRTGSLVVAWTLDKLGPITRSAADADLVLRAVGGEDAADPATIGSHLLSPRRGGIRVGVLPFPSDEDDVTRAVFAEALGVLRGLTGSMIDVALPAYDYRDLYDRIHVAETALAMREFVAHGDVDQVVDEAQRAGLHGYATLDPFDYVDATETRVAATRALRRMFTDIDVLVAPTLLSEATPLEADLRTWPARRRHYAVVGAVTGIPGVTVPMGFGESGLPLGLSILADVGHDRTALALAAAYQRATDWHRRVPTALAG